MLDVGQGDSSVITYGHKAWLIDGGGLRNKEGDNVGVNVLLPFLSSQGIREIEGAFISHFHYDHVKGLLEVGERIPIRQLYINSEKMDFFDENSNAYLENDGYEMMQQVKQWAGAHKIPICGMKHGDCLKYKEMQLTCVTPSAKVVDEINENNHSMIVQLSIFNTSMLFTGDMENEEEAVGNFTDIDILKVAHHGSSTSTTLDFLDKTQPELALISVGRNTYGHPSPDIIRRLEDRNITTYSTKDYGMLKITFTKKGYQLRPYK